MSRVDSTRKTERSLVFLVDIATQALEKYNIEKDIAAYIKKEFDKKYNPTWHWYVNEAFASMLMLIAMFVFQHCWPQLRLVCHSRNETLYLFLLGPSGYSTLQIRLNGQTSTMSELQS